MGRKNRRKQTEYRSRLGFNPWKYIHSEAGQKPSSEAQLPPRRGDIWFAWLGYREGTCVQGGCRPVLVYSNNIGNSRAETVNVLPMTSHLKKLELPCHTLLEPEHIMDARQQMEPSVILAEQITTIDKAALRNLVGRVADAGMLAEIDRAVRIQLGMERLGTDEHKEEEHNS